jgi:hypothetical protein
MAATYMRFCPRCVSCLHGYVTYLMGPRGGVHGIWPCIECGRMPTYKPSGYISYPKYSKPPGKKRPDANEDNAAA